MYLVAKNYLNSEAWNRECNLLWSHFMHYTFEIHKDPTLLYLVVLLSPFVPWADECSEQLIFVFNYFQSYLAPQWDLARIPLRDISSPVASCISAPLCICACNLIWPKRTPLYVCSPLSFSCSFRRSCIILRPKWRSTAITRSNWSCPIRSCNTWRL